MLRLIKKDFIAGWMFLIGVVLIIPFITTITIFAMLDDFGGLILGVFTFIVVALCVASAFIFLSVDTIYNADMIYASLPIKRALIVLARYLSSFMLTAGSYSLALLSCYVAVNLFDKNDTAFEIILSWRGLLSMLIFMFLILSFMFPFIFKFGTGKGTMAALITQISLVLIIPLIKFIMKALSGIFDFDFAFFSRIFYKSIQWLMQLEKFQVYLLLIGIFLSVILISISLSIRFFNHRDL
ncbi:ABC-2 transporter permease [candidate division KSB1 bacterium]|nr:ABC-2 transporter permease [candidate division KSB1 bacterium]